jgi:hypothetical protein
MNVKAIEERNDPAVLGRFFFPGDKERQNGIKHRVVGSIYARAQRFLSQQDACRSQCLVRLLDPVAHESCEILRHHAAIPSRRIVSTSVLSENGPRSNASREKGTTVITRSRAKPTSQAISERA